MSNFIDYLLQKYHKHSRKRIVQNYSVVRLSGENNVKKRIIIMINFFLIIFKTNILYYISVSVLRSNKTLLLKKELKLFLM